MRMRMRFQDNSTNVSGPHMLSAYPPFLGESYPPMYGLARTGAHIRKLAISGRLLGTASRWETRRGA